ncbi:hypothetical protein BDV96DRAFT_568072 [Lophiotrema nucula]|uniref:Uncharacterized protein n=1 Tax=Lophiotrema nucula TaxID=690887 RepID=A0A6A5ZJF7_9PLEO|nr:hypothetical protein BDV96DRAFT_568072 [Lophiotrema nucula]
MASVLQSPISAEFSQSMAYDAAKMDMTHLSGMTITDLIKEPQINLISASIPSSKRASISQTPSNRMSVASVSTTKSALRHSNQILVEMLQNIQTELSAHRTIMLDIQHRVSHLEHESVASISSDAPQQAALQALEGRPSKRNSKLVPPEGATWWQACQNFAKNSETPMSATEFLRTPKRFSGFDWQFGPNASRPHTPPPDVDELPPLTPTSEEGEGEQSDVDTPRASLDNFITSTPRPTDEQLELDIKEHTVEIGKTKLPPAPILLPPPAGKPISVTEPVLPIDQFNNSQRYYKGVRSSATFRALLKHKATDKEHHVLIHFHKRADLKDIDDES